MSIGFFLEFVMSSKLTTWLGLQAERNFLKRPADDAVFDANAVEIVFRS
jgi:hypothetical protein